MTGGASRTVTAPLGVAVPYIHYGWTIQQSSMRRFVPANLEMRH